MSWKAGRSDLQGDLLHLRTDLIDLRTGDESPGNGQAQARDRVPASIKDRRGDADRPRRDLAIRDGEARFAHLLQAPVDLLGCRTEPHRLKIRQIAFDQRHQSLPRQEGDDRARDRTPPKRHRTAAWIAAHRIFRRGLRGDAKDLVAVPPHQQRRAGVFRGQLPEIRQAARHQRIGLAHQVIHLDHLWAEREAAIARRHQEACLTQGLDVAIQCRPAVAQFQHQFLGRPFQPLLGKHLEHRQHPLQTVCRLHAPRRLARCRIVSARCIPPHLYTAIDAIARFVSSEVGSPATDKSLEKAPEVEAIYTKIS